MKYYKYIVIEIFPPNLPAGLLYAKEDIVC